MVTYTCCSLAGDIGEYYAAFKNYSENVSAYKSSDIFIIVPRLHGYLELYSYSTCNADISCSSIHILNCFFQIQVAI